MGNKIDLVEILRDCPKGMELDSTMYENLEFDYIDEKSIYPIKCRTKVTDVSSNSFQFTKNGQPNYYPNAKCVIFPKGKNTWEGFTPFKNGDIVATMTGDWIGITEGGISGDFMPTYCVIKGNGNFEAYLDEKVKWAFGRLATNNEKEKLFATIKDNGYCWNDQTKTLEKLKVPKFKQFKDGDILVGENMVCKYIIIYKKDLSKDTLLYYASLTNDKMFSVDSCCDNKHIRFATEEEKQKLFDAIKANGYRWNKENKTLEKLPKFKVGDEIVKRNSISNSWVVSSVSSEYYGLNDGIGGIGVLSVFEQDDWELVVYKFDINTLKAFDKVLVRDTKEQVWVADLFSHVVNRPLGGYTFACVGHYTNQCIPYKGNEHLLGKTDDCDEHFKNWNS